MQTNKKVLFVVSLLLGSFALVTIINVALNFRSFGEKSAIEKAHSIAESVRDGLTSHMLNDTMDKRFVYLDNMMRHQEVENLRTLRSKSVIEQFGMGNVDVYEYDDIEKKVMQNSQSVTKLYNAHNTMMMRVTIPYVATKYSNPNCLSCHTNVKEGDVLGVISMDMSIEDVYQISIDMIWRIIGVTFVFLLLSIVVANRYIRPYMRLFDDLETGISKAYRGDFTHYVTTNLSNEAGAVARRLNELSEIFRFKKTIELDENKEAIYKRLAYVLTHSFKIERFVIHEIDVKEKGRKVIYKSTDDFEEGVFGSDAMLCRAYRTSSMVFSSDFHDICEVCCSGCHYICIPLSINDNFELIVHIQVADEEEIVRINEHIPIIKNYFEVAKPVLESKILLEILHNTTLRDPMTGLYNRRYLDQFVDLLSDTNKKFSLLMIDIDFFKHVNDTYGHDMGDTVIKALAKLLVKMIKGSDIAVRFGGEEFVILLFDLNEQDALRIAQKIRHEFSQVHFKTDNESFRKTLSIGISRYPEHHESIWKVIKFADVALYEAKENGRDQVVLYKESMYRDDEF
jgi:diguanylate cyclase (GGDEF)-like protein